MRKSRFLLATVVALAAASCARQQQTYVIDPATGQAVPVMAQQYAQAPQASAPGDRGLFASQGYTQPQYAPPQYAQQSYAQQTYQQPAAQPAPPPSGRGLFNSGNPAPQVYGQPQTEQPYVLQYTPPRASAPQYAVPQTGGPYAAAPYGYASASPYEQPYTLDAGDKLRIVVFGQDGISNAYVVDAGGNVNLPLVGTVPARGATTGQLSQRIAERLKQGYVREPHVTVEVEAYRPFFILGEVTNPGQYPYVADMTVEKAIAIAGGFAPRASKGNVEITRNVPGQAFKGQVPMTYPMRPGDTVVVKERWF
jgi:polysaccharide export outer membrane protein